MKLTQYQRGISGFPEWLPQHRLIENQWIDIVRQVFESFGYASVETASVEEVSSLLAKSGDTDKEIYALGRLQAQEAKDAKLALHYDLTIPFARYVAQNQNELVFPFKRYSIQKAWRGERPQDGRFREFYQCDVDVVDRDRLPIAFDAEIPTIMCEVVRRLKLGQTTLNINNRKILQGFYTGIGIQDVVSVIRCVDKVDKIGLDGALRLLVDELGLPSAVAERCVALAGIRVTDGSFAERVMELGVRSELLDEGLGELRTVVGQIEHDENTTIAVDLSIARGFDYYTGSVYEFKIDQFPDFPSFCSGGRYHDLVESFSRAKLPGVGMSFGLTRIFSKLLKEGLLPDGAKSKSEVLVVFLPGADGQKVLSKASALRKRGINVECFHEPSKVQTQLRYADRKGIAFAYFAGQDGEADEVKDMVTGIQNRVDDRWSPRLEQSIA